MTAGSPNEKGLAATNSEIASPHDAERERLATLQAEFELAGHALTQLADGTLVAHRWGLSKTLGSSLDDARAWLRRVTGGAA
jgi:hypothetical protein